MSKRFRIPVYVDGKLATNIKGVEDDKQALAVVPSLVKRFTRKRKGILKELEYGHDGELIAIWLENTKPPKGGRRSQEPRYYYVPVPICPNVREDSVLL